MNFILLTFLILALALVSSTRVYAETFLTVQQAQEAIWQGQTLTPFTVKLSKEQRKSIRAASGTRVRNSEIKAWRTAAGDWFIFDQVIGKHENIDLAIGITHDGKVKDIEILTYRETYGGEIRNPKWLAQFFGKDYKEHLKLDKQIKNISGATLSCRNVTDGVNRLTHTWQQVLQYL